MPERSHTLNFVECRMNYLEAVFAAYDMAKGTPAYTRKSADTAEVLHRFIVASPKIGPTEAVHVIQAIRAKDVFTAHDRERIIAVIERRVDLDAEETMPSPPCTAILTPPPAHRKKQTMDNIQNYMTAALWDHMRKGDDHLHVLVDVAKLIVNLGVMFPSEKLFGKIVALIGFCHCGPLPPPMQLLKEVKGNYRAYRGNTHSFQMGGYVPTAVRRKDMGPQVYPQCPSELLTSHPHLHRRAYKETIPVQIPAWVDQAKLHHYMAQKLICRNTNRSHRSRIIDPSIGLRVYETPFSLPRPSSEDSADSPADELPSSSTTTAIEPRVFEDTGRPHATEVPDEADSYLNSILCTPQRQCWPAMRRPPKKYCSPKKKPFTKVKNSVNSKVRMLSTSKSTIVRR